MIWFAILIVSLFCVGSIALAVSRRSDDDRVAAEYDVAIYRDQLAEIARDEERGLISGDDAAAARTEVSRKLLAAQERLAAPPDRAGVGADTRKLVTLGVIALVPAIGLGLYAVLGSPGLPGVPYAQRQDVAEMRAQASQLRAQIATFEQAIADDPSNVEPWLGLGQLYLGLRLYDDAVRTFERATEALGPRPVVKLNQGIARVFGADGRVTPEAEADFRDVLAAEPDESLALYFLGVAEEQRGNGDAALALFQRSRATAPQGAPWLADLDRRVADLGGPPSQGPAAPQAGALPPDAIADMVAQLANRLETETGTPADWAMLIRSYGVLGDTDAARQALDRARTLFADDAAAQAQFDALAGEFGL